MIVPLMDAVADTCGGKAAALGALLRAGVPVPDGFVVPFAAYLAAVRDLDREPDDLGAVRRAVEARPLDATLVDALERGLGRLGDTPVAVRSSAAGEDTGRASAAGQHESFLAVRGAARVADAVRGCWASLLSPRAAAYRDATGPPAGLAMAVIVQRHLDAEVSGVMFTPADPGDAIRIEASWGLGPSVVGGTVTPDAYLVAGDGTVTRTAGDKRTRLDRHGARLVVSDLPEQDRRRPAIDDTTAARLAGLGGEIAAVLGGAQDIEWAIVEDRVWALQARPVTAAPPPKAPVATIPTETTAAHEAAAATLAGTPGSHGTVTGTARIVRGPGDFARVHPGDILVCPFTDPAWTPLLRIAAGVVTETGGVLSHAAIVAREQAIPAVLGIRGATSRLHDGTLVTIDGTIGTVTPTGA
ncbi:pyruvate, phosphate dikinase [Nonomuraea phyllanthi]|uniref:PEP/pyruvate-binding domain-containing protein n=1 Tax=Nonomuraea phyllanthi TaxID=2219224 RepID=UPI001293EC02|nr:PEP/pyruvate-binding domain-containing protein [Nonomuraea phyllanthi]QFY09549.1 pyruvate, phosphate dikinase [Nonomuraea phyllanthi]